MGRTYLFECLKCGYHARVTGGAGEGIHFAVHTIACSDCRALYDAIVRFKPPSPAPEQLPVVPPPFTKLINRLPPRGARFWLKFKPVCPVSGRHRVRLWKQPDKCPKCGNFMESGASPFRLWD